MSITITAENGIEFEVCGLGVAVVDHGEETETWARMSQEQRRALADALRGRERDEARKALVEKEDEAVRECHRAYRERDAAVARADDLDKRLAKVMSDYQDVEDERDEWKARAEQAERELADEYSEVNQKAAAWDRVAAHPALRRNLLPDVEGSYADLVFERITWLAEVAETVTELQSAPAVSRADIEKAIRGKVWAANREPNKAGFHRVHVDWATDAVWSLVSGDDPAVHVVRESNVEAQAALRNRFGEFVVNGTVLNVTTAEDCREKAQRHLDAVARCESIARAIEAEAAVDPVEAKARVEADRRYSGDPNHAFIEGAVWAARHLNEQEAGDE